MELAEQRRLLTGWRGRRLLACRAACVLEEVIENLGADDDVDPPPDRGLPAFQTAMQHELHNSVSALLRMILLMNDGQVSPQKLRRF